MGLTVEKSDEICSTFIDVVPQPKDERISIRPSRTHGFGVWGMGTKITIYKGKNRTLAGRFLNHGESSGEVVIEGNDVVIYPNTRKEVYFDYIAGLELLNEIERRKIECQSHATRGSRTIRAAFRTCLKRSFALLRTMLKPNKSF